VRRKRKWSCKVYIDDILVHTQDRASNQYWVGRVLEKLQENHLFCQEGKCQFKKEKIEFLGMEVSEGQVSVSLAKVEAVLKEVASRMKKGIRCFLRITNYHRKFIKDYSKIARLLHDLTEDVLFEWTGQCQDSFEVLKKVMMTCPVLSLPRDKGKFCLETDASDLVTGVLSQEQPDGMYRTHQSHLTKLSNVT
jgi:hypothetical protein